MNRLIRSIKHFLQCATPIPPNKIRQAGEGLSSRFTKGNRGWYTFLMNTSYRHIQLLPEGLQNQIAAGEVVERPASVVKELVENSLDAGSTTIHITVEDGGQSLIAIRDNGKGIPAADIPLALTRHATSKITSFQELTNIASYGFRGEALPSIASVSILRIESAFASATPSATLANEPSASALPTDSKAQGTPQPAGYYVEAHYGSIAKEGPCALHEGTHIVIRDLFANVPARLKFLKTPATELRRCQDTVTRLALAQPHCSFTFSAGTREIFTMPAGMSIIDRLAGIWPASVIESLLPIDLTHHEIHVSGFVSAPHSTQGKSDRLLLYVNNRPVTDKLMISAVRQAYKGRLTSREYPQGVVFVSIDPKEIDVNVHPAKTEIRFRDERALFSAIMRSIDNAFAKNSIFLSAEPNEDAQTPQSPTSRPLGFWGSVDSPPIIPGQQRSPYDSAPGETIINNSFSGNNFAGNTFSAHPFPESSPSGNTYTPSGGASPFPANDSFSNSANASPSDSSCGSSDAPAYAPSNVSPPLGSSSNALYSAQPPMTASSPPPYDSQMVQEPYSTSYGRSHGEDSAPPPYQAPSAHAVLSGYPIQVGDITCLGQVATTYLILVHGDELLLMDQHAAHERVLLTHIAASHNAGSCQLLALPEQLALQSSELEHYEQSVAKLTQLGYQTELDGSTLMVSGLPPLLPRKQALQFLQDILEDKTEGFDDIFHMMACRAAIKAGHILTADEAAGLLQQWLATPENMHCPHGRPILLRFGKKELEKLFKRTVG